MLRQSIFFSILVVFFLAGCTTSPVKVAVEYSRQDRDNLYQLSSWLFEGRVAVIEQRQSLQANIVWQREGEEEKIRLSGPFGQGAVLLRITNTYIALDEGEGEVFYSGDAESSIADRVGVYVPIRALKYWVLGLVEPDNDFKEIEKGFVQGGWTIEYKQMQQTKYGLMPYKINVFNQRARLKLVIDQWAERS